MRALRILNSLLACILWASSLYAQSSAVPDSKGDRETVAAAPSPEHTQAANEASTSPRWGLVAGGLAMFSLGWGPLCAAGRDERCIPFVGAGIVVYRLWNEEPQGEGDGIVPPRFVAIAASGLIWLQLGGAALTTAGFAFPKREPAEGPRVGIAPWIGPDTLGVSTSGRF